MNKKWVLLLLFGLVAGFVFGLFELFELRFESGDVYPAYSSLRADPLGTMALCESLQRVPGLAVRRDFNPNNDLPPGRDTTYLHLAARTFEWSWMDEDLIKTIEGFVSAGGRLAITFFPETEKPFSWRDEDGTSEEKMSRKKGEEEKSTERRKRAPKEKKMSKKSRDLLRRWSLKERWGLDFAWLALDSAEATRQSADLPLPEKLDWHSATIFTNLSSDWKTIYARRSQPVVIERKLGTGTVVMASDSYFLSNEAMLKDRHPELLSWWIGPSKTIVFDESHFGIVETAGVATLIRKYRLHGVIAGLLLLAALFIWKNSSSFVPAYASDGGSACVPGKDAASGFVNLLRRNVPARDVLDLCFAEWKKAFSAAQKQNSEKETRAAAILEQEKTLPARNRDAVQRYRELYTILKHP